MVNSLALKLFLGILLFSAQSGHTQSLYRIYFTDKNQVEYNPFTDLHHKAIERRILHGIDLCDISDYPLNSEYVNIVNSLSDSIHGSSRWLNAVFIYTNDSNILKITTLPFVRFVEKSVPVIKSIACNFKASDQNSKDFDTLISKPNEALLYAQIKRLGGNILKDSNLNGKGIRIAILDVGFKAYLNNPAFKHIQERNGIIATYDFVKKRQNVNLGALHGTNVFSCAGGMLGNKQIGLATGADYLLARTENFTEFFNEEENWLLAAEWADKHGADIINSSLGYTFQRYVPEDMNGKTAFVSKAAQLASDKGILVVSAAGNEGESTWKRVAAPGDAAGVLTVGGIDPATGIHIGFSSYGPSWDKRLKPEVSAYGRALVAGKNGMMVSEGTSFASPLVAGFAACAKQRFPNLKNQELKQVICSSGDLWPYYDYAHGYGVPQPFFMFKDTLNNNPTLQILEDNAGISIYPCVLDSFIVDSNTSSKPVLSSFYKDEKLFNKELNKTVSAPYFFYHIKNNKGYIDKYYVLNWKEEENDMIYISKGIAEKPFSIEFYYKGFYKEMIIKE